MITEQQNELIPMGIGELLSTTREKKGLSIETVSQGIKVKPEVLRAIEADDTGHIPAVYLRGYIRSYSRFLDIPWSTLEERVKEAGSEPPVQTIFKEGPPRNRGDRWIKSSSYVIASAVVIALVWQFTNEAVRFSQGDPILRPAQETTTQAQQAQSAGTVPGVQNPANPGLKHPPSNTHLRASIASMNSLVGQGKRAAPAQEAWDRIPDPENPVAGAQSGFHNLEIVTSADSWIEIVDGHGNRIEMDLLRAGSRRTYQGDAPFRLLLGRASSVEVFHNGEKIDLGPNTRGNVARITLGEEIGSPEPDAGAVPAIPEPSDTPNDQG